MQTVSEKNTFKRKLQESTLLLTSPIASIVFHGERTTKLRSFRLLVPLPPINHFKKGSKTPAMSRMDVKVFSRINADTYIRTVQRW